MTTDDLLQLIKQGENRQVEFKKSNKMLSNSLWESYSAFANTEGGTIVLGIDEESDEFVIVGVDNVDKTIKDLWNQVNNTQKVSVNILFNNNIYPIEVDGKWLIVIEVPAASRQEKPIFLKDDMMKYSFRRNHEGDYKCSTHDIKSMLRDQSEISIDTTITDNILISDLTTDTFRRYRNRFVNFKPDHIWNNLGDEEFLFKLGVLRRVNNILHPTYAGILMFAEEHIITSALPNFFLDYREIDNNNDTRWVDRFYSTSGLWSGNIFDFYFTVVDKLQLMIKTPFLLDKGIRVDDNKLHTAIREAVANTVIHSDYNGTRGVVVLKYTHYVEFQNPGLYRISLASALEGGISDPRNTTIFKMFNLIGVGERSGSGISSINYICNSYKLVSPITDIFYTPERVVFKLFIDKGSEKTSERFGETVKGSEKTSSKLLKLLLGNNYLTISELSELLNISTRSVEKHLSRFKLQQKIKRKGPDKGGSWEVLI